MSSYVKIIRTVCGAAVCCALGLSALRAQETVCARVTIQIEQELTLEREGFEARLGIVNGLPSALENFQVTLRFFDTAGNPVPVATVEVPNAAGKFFHRIQTGYTQPASVAAGAEQKVAYLIVPASGAAGASATGTRYQVGATIKYTAAGKEEIVEIAPDEITVRPMPELQLQYFLPGDVFGDDPLTTAVEPVVPFALGVRVTNHSAFATAKKLKIQSGQPEIIESEQGLLIDFRILGSTVNGAAAQPTLLADLGDIAPERAAMGDWRMTTSLSGKFVRFTAEVAHAPDLGGALTSLIPEEAISTHRLLGQVVVDFPGRDTIPDFLATDAMTGDYSVVKLYESDNDEVSTDLTYYAPGSSAVSFSAAGGVNPAYTLTVGTGALLGHVRIASPIAADKQVRAVRSDGKVLPSANSWVSRTRTPEGVVSYWLNLFDTTIAAGQAYTLTLTDPLQVNRPPALVLNRHDVRVRPGKPVTISITATDPDGTIPVLSSGALPDGATFVDAHTGQGAFAWTPAAAQLGNYTVLFKAGDGQLSVTDSARIVVDATASGFETWLESRWPGITDPAIIGSAADPDRDGLDNLLEYALDADPTVADDSVLPVIGLVKIEGLSYLTLAYERRTDDSDLVFDVVASEALHAPLSTWTVQTTVVETGTPDPISGRQLIKVRDSVSIETGGTHRYLRLRVTREDNP
ncbi:MAG: hypothetical protein K0R17_2972 [Rariglobus sp.]|jgi:hypothetical protein|nr:hypothetical protein [Rariglobus sp.]